MQSFLFQKMDTNHTSHVDWNEFCTYLMHDLQGQAAIQYESDVPLLVCPHQIDTAHRRTISRILTQTSPPRIMTISDDGLLCFWNLRMACKRIVTLDVKASRHVVVTDAVFMPNAFRIAVATTNRDICFFDSSNSRLINRLSLGDTASSLDYHFDPATPDLGTLLFGDVGGFVPLLEDLDERARERVGGGGGRGRRKGGREWEFTGMIGKTSFFCLLLCLPISLSLCVSSALHGFLAPPLPALERVWRIF